MLASKEILVYFEISMYAQLISVLEVTVVIHCRKQKPLCYAKEEFLYHWKVEGVISKLPPP